MATQPTTFDTTIDIEGFERNITATFWFNEVTMEVYSFVKVVLTDTGRDFGWILGDADLVEHLAERIEHEAEEERKQAAYEVAQEDYMADYL